ncbi:MAG: Uma2 family endonuclease [Selenomonadaceae bacterium]|nr:Uma2 family endonuclease [Selenomonadaceae bacterium]
MSSAALAVREEDYDEETYELINGETVMLAAAAIPHLRIQGYLARKIGNYLVGKKCEVFAEAKVVFDDKNWLQPDILVVCDQNKVKRSHIQGAPDFVAEILSPSTQYRDFTVKKDIYEKYGVREYWLIDPMAKNVFVHLLENGKYRLKGIYHNYDDEDWAELTEKQRAAQKLSLKLSLYDDLEISLKELFQRQR